MLERIMTAVIGIGVGLTLVIMIGTFIYNRVSPVLDQVGKILH